MASRKAPDEKDLLQMIRGRAMRTRSAVRVGIGDDCAVLTPRAGEELVITTDFSIEGRHFRKDWHAPEAVGYKCLARGLSDVAAMGGRPVAAFVSLAVPQGLTVASGKSKSWVDRFYSGLLGLADRERVTLAGGDLASSPSITFADIVLVGMVKKGRALLRSGAQAGDLLYVTGSLGGAAAELVAIERNPRKFRGLTEAGGEHPHFFPQPRLAVGQALARRRVATACIDISDGLSTDLLHLCEESGLSAELDVTAVPVQEGASLEQALHGGDDYELLFTAPAGVKMPRALGDVALHPIGRMVARGRGSRVLLTSEVRGRVVCKPLRAGGWQHF